MSASTTWSATTLVFGGSLDTDLRRRSVAAAFEYRVIDGLTLTAGGGASLGGDLRVPLPGNRSERFRFSAGPVVSGGAAYRVLDGEGWLPFILFGGAISYSTVGTTSDLDGAGARMSALDARFALTVGEVFANAVAPYVTARGFGGPVNWEYQGFDISGSDKFHYAVGGGVLATTGLVDAFIEVIPLGERAAVFGGAISF